MKKYLAGVLTGIIIMTTGVVYAETIDAIFGQIKLVVDGKPVDKETLLYNETTYVPIRAAAEILGKEVTYDDATKTAYLNDPVVDAPMQTSTPKPTTSPTTAPSATPIASENNKDNPPRVGASQTVSTDNGGTVDIKITNVITGPEAWKLVDKENILNEPPKEGYMYAVAYIDMYNSSKEDVTIEVKKSDFRAYADDGSPYSDAKIAEPNPEIAGVISKGKSVTGYKVFEILKADTNPVMHYENSDENSGWLKLSGN